MTRTFDPSIAALGARLRSGESSLAAQIATAQERIASFNPRYRAFSHLAPTDAAVETLETELRAGRARGPLHGIAASIKGNIPVAGMPWTEGSRLFAERRADQDAAIVAKLRAAGAVVLGTTTLSELAMYGVTNAFEPMGLNPWDPDRTAGGSSTGAGVATSLGLTPVNIGTDSGGSIRNPACHCGAVGFMPRIGALRLGGQRNYTPSLSACGIIAPSVEDVVTAFNVLAEPTGHATTPPSRRLLVPRRLVDEMCDNETLTLFAAALERAVAAGFTLVERDVDEWKDGEAAAGVISLHEGSQALKEMDLTQVAEGLRRRAQIAWALTAEQVRMARHHAAAFRAAVAQALQQAEADAFVSPTWPFAAPRLETDSLPVHGRMVQIDPHRNCFVRAANAIDACAISLPMGLYPTAQVPAGLHLMSVGGWEERLLAVAGSLAAAMPALPPPPPLR